MSGGIEQVMKKALSPKTTSLGWALLFAGIAIIAAGYLTDSHYSVFSNVVGFLFLTSLGMGALFLIAIEYLTGAVWSVPVRRVNEFIASALPFAVLLAIPAFFHLGDLFHWMHKEVVVADPLLSAKEPYLNTKFFVIRFAVIFALVILFYFLFTRNSLKQDTTSDQHYTTINTRLAAVFLPILALGATFIAIDWGMSLEPHWFSTMYGVYYISGTILAAVACATLVVVLLYENGYLPQLRKDHFYNFGALMFAFVNFWAYIAFCQFMLMWYANLPEETFWYMQRWENGWNYASIAMVIIHFAVPYFVLLSQGAKMDPKRLKIMAIWILFAHYFDLYWLVMPTHSESFLLSWRDLGYPVVITGLLIVIFSMKMKRHNLVPIGDPKLKRGLDFRL